MNKHFFLAYEAWIGNIDLVVEWKAQVLVELHSRMHPERKALPIELERAEQGKVYMKNYMLWSRSRQAVDDIMEQMCHMKGITLQSGEESAETWTNKFMAFLLSKAIAKSGLKEKAQKYVSKFLNLIEVIPLSLNMLFKAKSFSDIVVALVATYKMVTGNSILLAAFDFGGWLKDAFYKIVGRHIPPIQIPIDYTRFVYQSGEVDTEEESITQWILTSARALLTGTKDVFQSAGVRKLRDLLNCFFSFGLCAKLKIPHKWFNLEAAQSHAENQKFHNLPEFIMTILETVVWTCERAYQAVTLGSFSPFLHTSASYAKWVDRVFEVKSHSKMLGLPAECSGVHESELLATLKELLVQGESMMKLSIDKDEKKKIKIFVLELEQIQAELLTSTLAKAPRVAPFTLLVEGPPAVGKSSVVELSTAEICHVEGLPFEPQYIYTRSPQSKHWDGFTSEIHTVYVDDIGMQNPSLGTIDITLVDIIQLCNNIQWCPPQADLKDKGKTPMRIRNVISSTNTLHLNAATYYSCPLAVRRRFPYIVSVVPKKQFRKHGSCALNASILPPACPNQYPDYWDFTIKELRSVPSADGKGFMPEPVTIFEFVDTDRSTSLQKYLHWLHATIDNHWRGQDKYMASNAYMHNMERCPECDMPSAMCACSEHSAPAPIPAATIRPYMGLQSGVLSDGEEMWPGSMFYTDEDVATVRQWAATLREQTEVAEEADSESSFSVTSEILMGAENDQPGLQTVFEDAWMRIHTCAKMSALGMLHLSKEGLELLRQAEERVGATLADYVTLYQIKKAKSVFSTIGDSIQKLWSSDIMTWFFNVVAGAFVGFGVGLLLRVILSSVVQLQTTPGERPVNFKKDEETNPWYTEVFNLADFDVGSKTQGWNSLSEAEILRKVSQSVVNVQFAYKRDGKDYHIPANATCVVGHVYVTDSHCIPDQDCECHMMTEVHSSQINGNGVFPVQKCEIFRIVERDLAFFWCPFPPRAGIRDLVMKNDCPELRVQGSYVFRSATGELKMKAVENIQAGMISCPAPVSRNIASWIGYPKQNTIFGECGGPLVGFTPRGPTVLGLHQAALGSVVSSIRLTFVELNEGLSHFETQIQGGQLRTAKPLGELHPKSTFRFFESGFGHVFGSEQGTSFRSAPKSHVVPTYVCEAAKKQGFVQRCGQPAMKGWGPWRKGIQDTLSMKMKMSRSLVKKAANAYVDDILKHLPREELKELIVLDEMTAMNGYPGVKFIDKINRATSMGYPFCTTKRKFLETVDGEDVWNNPQLYTSEIRKRACDVEDTYLRGERAMAVYVAALKDEPTPFEKIEIEKTRLFQVMSAEVALVVRKYLLSFVRLFQRFPMVFEGAPGTNTQSKTWGEFREYLTKFGENRMIAGDYGKYDKRMEPLLILFAFYVIAKIHEAAGCSKEHLIVIYAIGEDIAYAVVYFQGDFIMLFGSNPSGQPLTVIINCTVNSLYMRICFIVLKPEGVHISEFKLHISLLTYGDDNTMGSGVDWFNHTAIVEVLASFGIVYTMADKHTASVPFINIDDVTFLKRSWQWSDDTKMWMCPLDPKSIDKMLTMCVKSRSVSPQKQSADAISSALCESFQYGRQKYNENLQKMKNIVEECGLERHIDPNAFCSYDVRCERYGKNAIGVTSIIRGANPSENLAGAKVDLQ